MKQSRGIRKLVLLTIVLLLSACSQTYSYLPTVGKPAEPPPEGAQAPGAGGAAPVAQSPADLAQQVQALQARVQQLENRLRELEATKAAPVAAHKEKAAQKVAKVPAPSTPSYPPVSAAAAEKSYNEGLKLYHGKKYGPARTQFYHYLSGQPQGAKAPEARYYLADSFYLEAKYKEAAVEFNKMASLYPKSILAPAALLRQALSYKQQQQTHNYQSTLRKLVKAYPNSPEAKEGQKWLKEAKKETAR
jgi:TolA-binding protein